MSVTFQTLSPVDGSVFAERPYADDGAIERALDTAREGQAVWAALPLERRQEYLREAVRWLTEHKADLAREITWQMGRPIAQSPFEVDGLSERAAHMIEIAPKALRDLEPEPIPGFRRFIKRNPVGTVFVIAPWNYPFLTSVNSIIPALLAGNAVLLKHSAQTPLCAERYQEAFDAVGLPKGVFQYLHLTHEDTRRVIESSKVQFVAFTGSVAGGHMVERAAAGRFIGVSLELGGKDPAYVRQDADLDHAVASTVDGALFNSGQSCCGLERVYVHRDLFDAYVSKAASLVDTYRLGRPDDPDTNLGPMSRASAAKDVRDQVDEAIRLGATAHGRATWDTESLGPAYLAPEILTDVNHQMSVMREETFGPVLPVFPVDGDEEAVRWMNDSAYGLTAAIYSADVEKSIEIGDRIDTGTLFLNRCDYLDPALAWTGVKDSGRGCALSLLGFEQFTQPKSYHLKTQI